MDVNTTTATTIAAVIGKSPERDTDAPPRIQPSKVTNGVLKRHFVPHAPLKEYHAPSLGIGLGLGRGVYKECRKNHAASIGGHALDGCGEFMPAPTATPSDPTSLKCAACGCHMNFHRREPDNFAAAAVIEYQPHHRHQPLPPPPSSHAPPTARESHSPPPISSSYPHMLLALSGGATHTHQNNNNNNVINSGGSTRKRFRTKFTQEQKDKMYELAERVGWKMQKSNEDMVNGVCSDIGVERGVFKVWMHNNKNTFAKRSSSSAMNLVSGGSEAQRNGKNNDEDDDEEDEDNNGRVVTHQDGHHHHHNNLHHLHYNGKSNESNATPANASSSSS